MKRHFLLLAVLSLLAFTSVQLGIKKEDISLAETAVRATLDSHPTTLEDIASLEGAVIDPETGQLMLVGQAGSSALNIDDFVVALRVIYNGDLPAVSIDPSENDNSVMNVVYFGGIENTHLGFVLYEADRLLKVYSMGVENLTGEMVSSNVPGYQSELDLVSADARAIGQPVWHRMWFEPAQLTNASPAGVGGRRGITLSGLGVTLNTEYISIAGSPIPGEGSDPAAEQFVAHFNKSFAAFAAEQPVLQELVEVRRWLYLARWLRDENIPIEASWLLQEVASVETPSTTPRTSVVRDLGPYRLMIGGGVDFTQENAYPSTDAFAATLADTLLSAPPGERAGTITVEGQAYTVVVLPLYRTASFSRTDADGFRWHLSTDDGRPLSVQAPEGGVTNFDEYDEKGRLLRKTVNYADNVVAYGPTDTGTARVTYQTEAAARLDLAAQIAAQSEWARTEEAASQYLIYTRLKSEDQLFMPEWHSLAIPTDGEMQVWPFSVGDEIWVALGGNGDQVAIPPEDLVLRVGEGTDAVQVARGPTAVDLYSRLLVAQASAGGIQFAFAFEADGVPYFQVGQELVALPDLTLEDLDDLLQEGNRADLSKALAPLLDSEGQTVVFFSGAGFPRTDEGRDHEDHNRRRSDRLTRALIRLGMFDVHSDDETEEATSNLAAQVPLVDQAGNWNLEIVLDTDSLAGEADKEEVDLITHIAEDAGIPLQTDVTAPTTEENLLVVTGRDDDVVESELLPELGEDGNLQDRYLVLLVIEQDWDDRSYVRAAIVDYGAAGVLVDEGLISLSAVRQAVETLVELRAEIRGLRPSQAILQTIQTQLDQPDLDDETRSNLKQLLRSLTPRISQLLCEAHYS